MAIKITMNKPVTAIQSLSVYLRGEKKIGKTTLFKNVGDILYNGDASRYLLVGVGNEVGYSAIGNIQTAQAENWKDFEELKRILINGKGKDHNIEMVCFDTADEWMPIAEAEVCRLSQIKTQKKCDGINSAFGGFGRGQEEVLKLVKGYISDLRKAGIAVWVIAHTKDKTIKEKGMNEDEGYQVLTSSLTNKYEGLFGDMFDMVFTGYRDRSVENGKVTESVRKLAFRGTHAIDAGCRIGSEYLPDSMEFAESEKETAKEFVRLLRKALRETSDMDEKEYEAAEKKEVESMRETHIVEEDLHLVEVEIDREALMKDIRNASMKNKEFKTKVMDFLKTNNMKNLNELTDEQLSDFSKEISA